jgi:hypothetical protein
VQRGLLRWVDEVLDPSSARSSCAAPFLRASHPLESQGCFVSKRFNGHLVVHKRGERGANERSQWHFVTIRKSLNRMLTTRGRDRWAGEGYRG